MDLFPLIYRLCYLLIDRHVRKLADTPPFERKKVGNSEIQSLYFVFRKMLCLDFYSFQPKTWFNQQIGLNNRELNDSIC